MNRRFAAGWIAAAMALLALPHLAGCGGGGGGSGAAATRTAVGYVKDAATQGAVAGATVAIGTRTATTASDGRYRISGLPSGVLVRSVSAPGYSDYADTVTLQLGVNALLDVCLVDAPPPPPP